MGKKKANKLARGYATTSVVSKRGPSKDLYESGKTSRKVQVSVKAQSELADLLDELKLRYASSNSPKGLQPNPIDVSPDNKRFLKKVINLYDGLVNLKFNDEQIKMVIAALLNGQVEGVIREGNSGFLSLESALDWLCLNLPSKDLPKLFTEANLEEENETKLEVVKPKSIQLLEVPFENTVPSLNRTMKVDPKNHHINYRMDRVKSEEEEEMKADAEIKRALLIQQYQYEESEDGLEDEKDILEEPKNDQNVIDKEESPEEIKLKKVEEQIREDEAELNDEAANYMRSKYETMDIKKRLKKLINQAKGLRAKMTKHQAKAERQLLKDEGPCSQEADNEMPFDLFANKISTSNQSKDIVTVSNLDDTTVAEPDQKMKNLSIPNDWTGKTPKTFLSEYCQKRKLPKPIYKRIPSTQNGCRVTICLLSQTSPVVFEQKGPFRTYTDAQHFVSTVALFDFNPELPLYRLFPPAFRELWKGWLNEKEREKSSNATAIEDAKMEKIINMIKSIPTLTRKDVSGNTQKSLQNGEGDESNISGELGDWDDDSCNSSEDLSLLPSASKQPTQLGRKLKDRFENKVTSMLEMRSSLPIFEYKEKIINTMRQHPVTVLCAETGAGKTTQCGQYILEDALKSGFGDCVSILCTQPRRISAISVAERVAEEMEETIGRQVGYSIRMDSKRSSETKLLYCTTGVVLRRLQEDRDLEGVTHVIVDEVHERQWQIDFLLIALRNLLQTTRRDLKVILMSATLDSQLFCSFFHGAPFLKVPGRTYPVSEYFLEDILDATGHIIEADSRYANRETFYNENEAIMVTDRGGKKRREIVSLDSEIGTTDVSDDQYQGYNLSTKRSMARVNERVINYDLIEDILTVLVINTEKNEIIVPPKDESTSESIDLSTGSILIFFPGIGEISCMNERLKGSRHFGNDNHFEVIPLHSSLSPKDQKRAFKRPQAGRQKIILATNIAETSVTIPDCVCVIDTGLEKEIIQDKRTSTSTLVTTWCSRASTKQRAGRAGRVQPGICCKLYSSNTANHIMKKQATAELQRVPLEEVCLGILGGGLANNCMDFLLKAPQPPSEISVKNALKVLEEVGAIYPQEPQQHSEIVIERLTPLGNHLAKLPVHVRLGKMLIFGVLFKVLDKALTIAACLSSKSPFSANLTNSRQAEAAHRSFAHESSDFLTLCNVWESFASARQVEQTNGRKFCDKNFLNYTAMVEIADARKHFFELLSQIGFVDENYFHSPKKIMSSSYNKNLLHERIVSAVICAGLYPNLAHATKGRSDQEPTLWHKGEQVYFHKNSINYKKKGLDTEWVVFHEKFATRRVHVCNTSLIHPFSILLFGGSVVVKHLERTVIVDNWIELKVAAQTGLMFRELRSKIASLLESRFKNSRSCNSRDNTDILEGVVRLLNWE